MTNNQINTNSDILGYKLDQRIGSGGFGEVWSAVAPGGIRKALKIVYGFHDEKRAQAELKALDRVKSLRHPFLLSLERIEVYEGQLVVVTELADASLADRFNECVAKGEPGISRGEMLRYMSNAAEALDYLTREKSLQHLDIKPENLLLVSGHVKVADFGLMKDLKAASQSLMQGMTPAYAAPELFDGQPAVSSDQYSLAIMYCEMITGVRPFPGTTPAQLAAQHMHGKPNLRPIPRGDQSAVARALSKDPNVRYPSCVAFVEDLKKQRRSFRKAPKRNAPNRDESSETLLFSRQDSKLHEVTEMVSERGLPFQPNSMVTVAPPACNPEKATAHPAIVITIGQTANRIGEKFNSKLLMRAGVKENVPSIRTIYIDSDRKDLASLENLHPDTVNVRDTIETPLRKPEDYRENVDKHFGWLSRRWIYNVPRTLQTEGLRPLGRLVFADYFTKICDRLEEVVDELAKVENLAITADKLGMNPGSKNSPRVYIVSSISGGIGSGMMLDLAYTVRLILSEKGIAEPSVIGVLLNSSYQRMRDPGLSAANAFAFLTEMRHFNEYGYPGDQTLGIPEFEDEPPFDHTYYAELGDDLNRSEFDDKLDSIAEYISLSSTTRCSEFFEACRKTEEEMEHFALRTLGIASIQPGESKDRERLVKTLCQKLVQRWVGQGDDPAELVDGIFEQFGLDEQAVESRILDELNRSAAYDRHDLLTRASEQIQAPRDVVCKVVGNLFDGVFGGASSAASSDSFEPRLRESVDLFLSNDPISGRFAITRACNTMMSLESLSLGTVEQSVAEISERLTRWSRSYEAKLDLVRSNIEIAMGSLDCIQSGKPEDAGANVDLPGLIKLREREFVLRVALEYVQIILTDLQPINTVVDQIKSNLNIVANNFVIEESPFAADRNENIFDPSHLMLRQIESKLDSLVDLVERQVYHALVKPEGGYKRVLNEYAIFQYSLANELRVAAQQALCHLSQNLSLEEMIRENHVAPEQLFQWINHQINEAKPVVSDCGGKMSMLVAMPTHAGASSIPELIQCKLKLDNTAINGTDGKLAICFEADDVSLAAVAFRLLVKRPDAIELVKRIHSRNDIEWTTLDDLL